MRIIAHRGASFFEPENTLRSIKRAMDMGADMVEVDVRLSKDGKLVVIHDATVDRTTNGSGHIKDMSLFELKKLDAGLVEQIPTLEEVIELVKDKISLVVEIKIPAIEDRVVETIQEKGLKDVLVTSFYHRVVKNVGNIDPSIETGIIFACQPLRAWKMALDAGSEVIFPRHEFVDANMVENAHKHGIFVYPWTIDDPGKTKDLIKLGVDGIVTNKLIGIF